MTPIWSAIVKEGKTPAEMLGWSNPAQLCTFLKQFIGVGVNVAVKKLSKNRSLNQNNYYWGVIVPAIAEYTGFTNDEAHEALKAKFLTMPGKGSLNRIKSTTGLSTLDFEAYCENIRRWAALEYQISIPEPNEVE